MFACIYCNHYVVHLQMVSTQTQYANPITTNMSGSYLIFLPIHFLFSSHFTINIPSLFYHLLPHLSSLPLFNHQILICNHHITLHSVISQLSCKLIVTSVRRVFFTILKRNLLRVLPPHHPPKPHLYRYV